MHFRIKAVSRPRGNFVYKLQRKVFWIFWEDCVDGVDGTSFVPTFSSKRDLEGFAEHYSSIRNEEIESLDLSEFRD